ncbi:uncharacterized protein LOC118477795 [Aplysia californica]|uniref:Uncharacterized protein LOC118477795 n=1 Tax=Aplysia californica TaxID=6500 RepID=A0ABM1VUA8_APLCA|nr:uncharacterized protein LOC118477795 [Aplysia californica]
MGAGYNTSEGALMSLNDYIVAQQVVAYSGILISIFGTVSNCINIKTFLAMGIRDGVIVSFLSLSISDLLTSIMTFILSVCLVLHVLEISKGIIFSHQPRMLAIFAVDLGFMTYLVTVLTTMYIAVTRCLCVVRPLHFKNTFSRSRSIAILVSFNFLAISSYIPLFANQGVQKQFSKKLNRTRFDIWLSPEREKIKDGLFLVTQTIIPFVTEFVIIVCVMVMINSLRKASRFRKSASSAWTLPSIQTGRLQHVEKMKEKQTSPSIVEISELYQVAIEQDTDTQNKTVNNRDDEYFTDTPSTECSEPALENVADSHCSSTTKLSCISSAYCISEGLISTQDFEKTIPQTDVTIVTEVNRINLQNVNGRKTSGPLNPTPKDSHDYGREPILGLSGRDLQVVNQVVLISVIFIVLNTPSMVTGVAGVLVPEFDANWEKDKYVRLYLFASFLRRVLEQINCSLNIFIYFRFNSKFRNFLQPKCIGRFGQRFLARECSQVER